MPCPLLCCCCPRRSAPHPEDLARAATLREQLSDLARQAEQAVSGQLLDALRVLTQLQPVGAEQQAQRQRMLRTVVDLRVQLQVC